MSQLDCGRVVTTISRRIIDRCRNVDFTWDERCPVFLSVLEELCGSSRYRKNRYAFQTNQRRMYNWKAWPCSSPCVHSVDEAPILLRCRRGAAHRAAARVDSRVHRAGHAGCREQDRGAGKAAGGHRPPGAAFSSQPASSLALSRSRAPER
jgi:hypothetical protein